MTASVLDAATNVRIDRSHALRSVAAAAPRAGSIRRLALRVVAISLTNTALAAVTRRRNGSPPRPESVDGAPGGGAASGRRLRDLRILIITSEAPPIVSGVSRSVDRLATGLRALGHHVDVLSCEQIPRVVFGEIRLSSLAARWPVLARCLHDYDVINLHGPVPTMSDAFLLLSRLVHGARCPIVYTHHSALEINGAERLCALYNRLHRVLTAQAALTITTSRYYAEQLTGTQRPVWVVPWGVDVRPEPLRRRGGLRPLRVLFVGQMRPYKGVESLLSAVAGRTELELRLVGRGEHLRDYQLLAAGLGGTNVQFLGRLPDDRLLELYDRSDVVVLPSVTKAEAFGLAVLEGMAAGCVPVVSDLPGVRDLVSRAGVVVPPRDVDKLRAVLLDLAADRTRLEYLSRAARRRAEGLGWDTCVARYEQAFFSAVGNRAGRLPVEPGAGARPLSLGRANGGERPACQPPAVNGRAPLPRRSG